MSNKKQTKEDLIKENSRLKQIIDTDRDYAKSLEKRDENIRKELSQVLGLVHKNGSYNSMPSWYEIFSKVGELLVSERVRQTLEKANLNEIRIEAINEEIKYLKNE